MAIFPSSLTEEEEALQKKYAKLKKKVKKKLYLRFLIYKSHVFIYRFIQFKLFQSSLTVKKKQKQKDSVVFMFQNSSVINQFQL